MKKVIIAVVSVLCMNTLFAQPAKTVAQWFALAKSGEKKLAGANLTGSNMSKMNLAGVDFSGANLTGVNLADADLTGASFDRANLTGVSFTGANLTQSIFLATDMKYVNFRNANLQQALLQEANLEYAILNGANLTSSNVILANFKSADLQNADFTNALLTYDPETPVSQTMYEDKKTEGSVSTPSKPALPAPDIIETSGLGAAAELYEKDKTAFIKWKGAKINEKTKGIDKQWAIKHGAVFTK